MIRLITDSSALILLAKCDLLRRVCDLFEVIAPPNVPSEFAFTKVITDYPDADLIAALISNGWIKVQKPGAA